MSVHSSDAFILSIEGSKENILDGPGQTSAETLSNYLSIYLSIYRSVYVWMMVSSFFIVSTAAAAAPPSFPRLRSSRKQSQKDLQHCIETNDHYSQSKYIGACPRTPDSC
jgi:hypothetical protein